MLCRQLTVQFHPLSPTAIDGIRPESQVRTGLPAWRKGDSNPRSLSRSKTLLGHAFRRLWLRGSNPGGQAAAVGVMSLIVCDQNLAAGLRHRPQPCSGCAGNFRSSHLIPSVRCQRCSKAPTVAEAMRVASGIASSGRSGSRLHHDDVETNSCIMRSAL